MLRILTFIVLFSEIEMYFTQHNRTVILKINDQEIHESKNGKNEVNKGKIYSYVDQEDVKISCNAYNLTSKHWVLYLKEGESILKSYCSDKSYMNGEVAKNITLTANMSGRHYKCEIFVGSQLNRSIINDSVCSVNEEDLEAMTSIVLKVVFRVAKLNIFVNKCKLKKNNIGTEVVYKYTNNEKVLPMCVNDDAANEVEWLPPAFYFFAIYEHKLSSIIYSYSKTGLTAKENGSYFDCVEKNYPKNETSRTDVQRRPKLRLRLILLDENEPRPTCSKDPESCPNNDLDADKCNNQGINENDLCIIGFDESKVTKKDGLLTYRYNNTNQTVKLECHRKTTSRNDTYIQWIGPSIASNKTNCKSQILFVNLDNNINRRVYSCEGGNDNEKYVRAAIEFIYVDPKVEKPLENLNQKMSRNIENTDVKSLFKPEHWILLSIGIICLLGAVIAIVKRYKIWKMRKSRKQDKVDLNLDNSRSDDPEEYTNILQSLPKPKLCETYTEPKHYNTINPDIYCEPYSAMYLQPLPKRIRLKQKSENDSNLYNNDPYSDEKKMDCDDLVNDYTTASYMNIKQTRDNVNNDPNVYDVLN